MNKAQNKKIYLVGGGIASLSAAFFLLKDGKVDGRDIVIMENTSKFGGSLDGERLDKSGGYIMRGHRILDSKTFECTFALLDRLPSAFVPNKSIKEEIIDFNKKHRVDTKARLIDRGQVIDAHRLGLNTRDRLRLSFIMFLPEILLESKTIKQYFSDHFFSSNFWYEFATTFAFQPWHSLVEFKRYILRSFHALEYYDTMECIVVPPLCYHDAIVDPLINYLKARNVNFLHDTQVIDLEFEKGKKKDRVSDIIYRDIAGDKKIKLKEDDIVITTLGSMTANSSLGDNDRPAPLKVHKQAPSWAFWERLNTRRHDLGDPQVFDNAINRSKWMSFTITLKDPLFFDLAEKITGNKTGSSGGTTFKNSAWFLSIGFPHQPHFKDQPEDIFVSWGYALCPDKKGDFVKKKMSECSGQEILKEICFHLGIFDRYEEIKKQSIVIPCNMPYITSQFAARKKNDRPKVVPEGISNLGIIGQFVEVKNDISFTVELSVRSAQMAVYDLLSIDKKIPKVYKGYMNIKNIIKVIGVIFR